MEENMTELRAILLKQAVQLEGLEHRVKFLEEAFKMHKDTATAIARLEERLQAQEARIDERIRNLESKMDQWRSIIMALVLLLVTQFVLAGMEFLKGGRGP